MSSLEWFDDSHLYNDCRQTIRVKLRHGGALTHKSVLTKFLSTLTNNL